MSETTEAAAPEAGTADDELRANAAQPVDTQDDSAEGAESTEEQTDETPEIEEIELAFGAKTLKVPKSAIPDDVRAELEDFTKNIQGDYTRKTQEVAEQRKAAEAERELFQKLTTLKGDALKAFNAGQSLAAEIQQLEQIDLREVWQSNPDQARQISDRLNMSRAEFQKHVNTVAQHEATMAAEEQQAIAKLEEAGRAEMQRTIKGFDEAAEKSLIEYAVKNGIPESDAKRWPLNPRTAAMAWKAMQFDALQAKTKAATAAKPAPAPAAPVKAVAGKSAASALDWDRMSPDEFARRRNEQEAKRRMAR
jgi:hypothetical protein